MKYYLFFLFLLLSSVEANSSQWWPGATTPTCIDWDSDGYGVGAGCTADGPLLYSLSRQSTYNGCVSATDYINATETHSSFLSNGIDTINLIKQITVSNNLFYDVSNGNIFRLKNSTGDCGSPINAPSPDADTVLGWIAFTSHSPQYTGNVNADPLFTDVFQGYWATPSNNNFSPTSNSPAIGVATPSTVTTDIAGAVRSALSPTLGAIEVGQLGKRYNIKSITKQD